MQGLFHLPEGNETAIAKKAVEAAIGLQSSMQHTLKVCIPQVGKLQLKVGIDMGMTLVSRLGIRGQLDAICLGETVENAATCEERCEGGQIGITKRVRDVLPKDFHDYFKYDPTARCYTANLIYNK